MSTSWVQRAVVAAALLGVWAGGAQASRAQVAGDEHALWLLWSGEEGRFDLVARPAGGKWQWVARGLSGTPAAAAADGAALHVVFTSGQYYVFDLASREGSPGLSVPGAPVALCLAAQMGLDGGGLVAMVPTDSAATGPAESGLAGATLTVLIHTQGRWQHLATVTGYSSETEKVRMAAWQGALYVLGPTEGAGLRLTAWQKGKWRDVAMPAALAGGQAVALTTVGGKLAAVVALPAEAGEATRLEIAVLDEAGGFAVQPITATDGQDVSWSPDDAPAVSVLSDKVAIVWGSGDTLKLATCSPATGRLDPIEDVTILQQPQADERAEQIREYFLWGLLVAILIPLFVLRPGGAPKPFSLPAPLAPAPLTRRLIAGLADLLPFHLAGGVYLHFTLPMPPDEAMRMLADLIRGRGEMPVEVAYAWAGTIVAYLVYGVLMEMHFGATVGKMLFGLRVVSDEGAPPRRLEILLRNLLKVVEVFFFAPLLLAVLMTRYRQRLGDMAARTAVIDARLVVPPALPPQDPTGRGDSADPPSPPPPPYD